MNKLFRIAPVIFAITLSLTSYSTTANPQTDTRHLILLTKSDKNLVLTEMRLFLDNIQKIIDAIAREDMPAVVKYARKVGIAEQQQAPASLRNKLPLHFKKLGRDTHQKFDALALNAKDLADSQFALEQLSELMQNCVACHSAYKINSIKN